MKQFPSAAFLLCTFLAFTLAFPSVPEDDRFLDREFASPGGHQLASWLVAQMRKSELDSVGPLEPSQEMHIVPYRLPMTRKRNSEIASAIMGLPTRMIDNGRKK